MCQVDSVRLNKTYVQHKSRLRIFSYHNLVTYSIQVLSCWLPKLLENKLVILKTLPKNIFLLKYLKLKINLYLAKGI